MKLKLDWTIQFGHILTIITIIISVLPLLYTLHKDREIKVKEQADRIRSAAVKTMASLDRWQYLNQSLFTELHPVFVETKDVLVKKHDNRETLNYLYKNIYIYNAKIATKLLDEHIEIAFYDLYVILPKYGNSILMSKEHLDIARKDTLNTFLKEVQDKINSAKDPEGIAELGDSLIQIADRHQNQFIKMSDETITQLKRIMKNVMDSSDSDIIQVLPNQKDIVDEVKNPLK